MPEFFDHLEALRERMARLTSLVQQAAELSVRSILNTDVALAQRVDEMDAVIDDAEVQIEKQAIDLLCQFKPGPDDVRHITVIIKANNDFERIADCAVNAAQRVVPLVRGQFHVPADLRLMCTSVLSTLRDTINAFNLSDESMARQVLKGDDVVDALYLQIVQDTLGRLQAGGGDANVELSGIMIAKNMERIGDHCTNIAENVVFAHTGQIIRHLHSV
jgi:phosphate transport system protein